MNDDTIASVLILEDRPVSQRWLGQAVADAFGAVNIEVAATLAQARVVINQSFGLALIDLELPDGSGIDLIRALRKRQPDCRLVVATIYDDDTHLFAALRAGADGYLLKDQSLADIAQLLQGITRGQAPLSPGIARRLLATFRTPPEPRESQRELLTAREREVLGTIADGYRLAEAADRLGISRNTVAYHVKNIYQKLQINNRAQAVREAGRLGLVDTPR